MQRRTSLTRENQLFRPENANRQALIGNTPIDMSNLQPEGNGARSAGSVAERPPRTAPPVRRSRLPTLTERQASILQLTAIGFSTREVAAQLGLSPQAISYHVGKLLQLTGTRNRTALIAMALVKGLLSSDQWPPQVQRSSEYPSSR